MTEGSIKSVLLLEDRVSRRNEQLSKRPEHVIDIHSLLGEFLAGNMCIFHVH